MLDQNECTPDNAYTSSIETRPTSGILAPASENGLNMIQDPNRATRKRKRDANTMEDLLDDAFVVKPHPSTVFIKPRTLRPIALIPRVDLPLASLDTFTSSSTSLPPAQTYEGHVKILELEQRMGNTPMVVIARLDDAKTYYAVELAAKGLLTLCKLGSWVDLSELCTSAVVSKQLPRRPALPKLDKSLNENLESTTITPESTKYEKKKRLAIEAIQSLVKRPSVEKPTVVPPVVATTPSPVEPIVSPAVPSQDLVENTVDQDIAVNQPKAADLLENIRAQYLESLYLSKTSLAYFAKGPLSRARAAFHLDYDSTLDMQELVNFLEGLVLTTITLDKKYKDGVPEFVSGIAPGSQSGDEAQVINEPKIRKRRKMKPGKTGLYPNEETLIRRWWSEHSPDIDNGVPGVTLESMTKDRISQLRIRETQLQIIVILEALALQPLAASTASQGENLPSAEANDISQDGKPSTSSKAKKSRDLNAILDIHVDRLCIWQSITTEDGSISKTTQSKDQNHISKSLSEIKKNAADILREFCVEVIVPFFSSRLPDQCKAINRKLGGPVTHSSTRSKSSKSATEASRPGSITKRSVPNKPRRSLQRVLTDDKLGRSTSRGPSGAISLMRSATAPVIPGLKREGSETPSLSSIQSIDSQSLLVSRAGVQKSRKFSQREVDLNSLAAGPETKAKKPSIEAELKDAISALKRPNRQLAGQSFAEFAEQRTSSVLNRSKSKSALRKPNQPVQILATPKPNRRKSVVSEAKSVPELEIEPGVDYNLPPSSTSAVPQSSVKGSGNAFIQATPSRPSLQIYNSSAIEATPSKPMERSDVYRDNRISHGGQSHLDVPVSPVPSRHFREQNLNTPMRIQATPVKQSVSLINKTHRSSESLGPFKTVANLEQLQSVSPENRAVSPAAEGNIYEALGWNDVDDLL